MTNTERIDLTCRHELEIQQVIDLANVVGMYHNKHCVPDVIEDEEFFDEVGDPDRLLHPSVQPLNNFLQRLGANNNEVIIEHLSDDSKCEPLLGIYLQVATPKMRKGGTFSWGLCRLQWIFGNTYDEAFTAACEWAKEQGHDYD